MRASDISPSYFFFQGGGRLGVTVCPRVVLCPAVAVRGETFVVVVVVVERLDMRAGRFGPVGSRRFCRNPVVVEEEFPPRSLNFFIVIY